MRPRWTMFLNKVLLGDKGIRGKMIIIYTQDETYIRNDADSAKEVLLTVYGEKLGSEAYAAVKDAGNGTTYRKNGGPLIRVVTMEEAVKIREKETAIGMMK